MERTLALECKNKIGQKVIIKGWMHDIRKLGKINFLILRDRSGLIQIVIQDPEELNKLKGLYTGTVLYIEGDVSEAKQTGIGVEIQNPRITVISPVRESSPVEYNKDDIKAGQDTMLDYRPIILRNRKIQAIFKVQSTIIDAFRETMKKHEFIEFRSPVLQESASEGGTDVFEVKYFDRKAYLAQSPQLYKQIMIGAFERVYTITPVFRAEKHHTNRHLTEITQMDGEMAFINDRRDVQDIIEDFIRNIFVRIKKDNKEDLLLWNVDMPKIPKEFPRINVKEGLRIVEKRLGKSSKRDELDLDPEDERELGKWAKEEFSSDFLWVENFKKNKNFYTWNNPDDPDESLSYDLHFRGIEILSGTIRIENYDKLIESMDKFKLDKNQFKSYLMAFKYGIPPEAGFSFGLERITQKIFNFENVRSATLFPRDVERLSP